MDIGSLLNQAGGIGAIAQQLGVDEATVERGAGALLPHVENGVETQGLPAVEAAAADPQALAAEPGQGGFLGGLLGAAMGEGGLMSAGAGGGGILGSLIGGGGNEILGQIFGSKDKSREVASQASEQSGVDPSILKKLLPIVAGAVAMHYMKKRGHGGAAAGSEGGGGLLGSILGGLGGR